MYFVLRWFSVRAFLHESLPLACWDDHIRTRLALGRRSDAFAILVLPRTTHCGRTAFIRSKRFLNGHELLFGMASTRQIAAQIRALRWAQASVCAGCGSHVPSSKRLKRFHPDYPTFDHVITRSDGGQRKLNNGLLKHQRCNQSRGSKPPTGCDLIWLDLVRERLLKRPKSFKPTFKGGVPNVSWRPKC